MAPGQFSGPNHVEISQKLEITWILNWTDKFQDAPSGLLLYRNSKKKKKYFWSIYLNCCCCWWCFGLLAAAESIHSKCKRLISNGQQIWNGPWIGLTWLVDRKSFSCILCPSIHSIFNIVDQAKRKTFDIRHLFFYKDRNAKCIGAKKSFQIHLASSFAHTHTPVGLNQSQVDEASSPCGHHHHQQQ